MAVKEGVSEEIAEASDDLKAYEFLECRTLGHAWLVRPAGDLSPNREYGTTVQFQCTRCEMIREDVVNNFGEVVWRSYTTPPGYRKPWQLRRSQYRTEMVRRFREEGSIVNGVYTGTKAKGATRVKK